MLQRRELAVCAINGLMRCNRKSEALDVIAPIAVHFAGQSRPTSSAACTGLLRYSSTKLAAANKAAFTKAMKATVR